MNMDINSMDNRTNETNRVDIKKIEERLKESFSVNPIFDPNNVGKDNSVEDKIVSYVMKLSETVNINIDGFYERMKSLKMEPLSMYANNGLVSYDSASNTGFISANVLKNDEENKYNVDNIFAQLMLMITTAREIQMDNEMINSYGFGHVRELDALNKACTYMIASNLVGSSEKSNNEEELMLLNMLNKTLKDTNSKIDFIDAYFSNNGQLLKSELNTKGINDDILNEINYLNEAKLNGLNVPDRYASISNKINRNYAMFISNRQITDADDYTQHLLNDKVLDFSTIGVERVSLGMRKALEYVKNKNNNMVNINNYNKPNVMQKAA